MKTFDDLFKPRWIFFLFLAVLVYVLSVFPIFDSDAWLHLKTGEYLWFHRALPSTDIFSYTIFGKPWILHEWLSQVIFYGAYRYAGLNGLILFKASLAAVLFVIMIRTVYQYRAIISWIILGLSFLILRDGFRERPQLFSYLLCALYVFILRNEKRRWLTVLPLLQVLWANLHGASALIGFGLVLVYSLFSPAMTKKAKGYIVAGTFLGMFVNPYTYRIFVYLFVLFQQHFNTLILEYRPPALDRWFIPYFVFLVLTAAALLLPFKRKAGDTAAVLISMAASFSALRNIPLFVIIAAPMTIERFSLLFARAENRIPGAQGSERLRAALERYPSLPFAFTLAMGLIFSMLLWFSAGKTDLYHRYAHRLGDGSPARGSADMLQFCVENGFKGPLFNEYSFGGYLMWRLYPEQRVFVDGRLVEFGYPFVANALNYSAPSVWRRLEDRYKFTGAVIAQNDAYNAINFDKDKQWYLIYWDDASLLYLKAVPENLRIISKLAYVTLRPNSPDRDYLFSCPRAKVLQEIDRALMFAPDSEKARALKEFANSHQW